MVIVGSCPMAHAHFLYIYRGYIYIHQIFTFSPPLLDNHGGLQNCINKSCASLNDSSYIGQGVALFNEILLVYSGKKQIPSERQDPLEKNHWVSKTIQTVLLNVAWNINTTSGATIIISLCLCPSCAIPIQKYMYVKPNYYKSRDFL